MRALAAIESFGRGAAPLLADMRQMATFERDARKQDRAIALLVDSPVTRMMASFFWDATHAGTSPDIRRGSRRPAPAS